MRPQLSGGTLGGLIVSAGITIAVTLSLALAGCSRRTESTHAAATASARGAPAKAPTPQEENAAVGVVDAWLFVATPDELSRAFVGWARPLPLLDEFVTRAERNPFTGKQKSVRTRVPDSTPRAAPDALAQPDLARFELLGRKGLSPVDVVTCGRAVLDWDEDNARSEVYGRIFAGPPAATGVLLEVPPALTARLAALSPADSKVAATRWAALFKEDAATIQDVTTRQHFLSLPDSEFVAPLGDLAKVARKALAASRPMFLWTAT
jgi:hypothetical protein